MNKLKSYYVSIYVSLLFIAALHSFYFIFYKPFDLAWLGAAIALLPAASMFLYLMTFRVARTSENVPFVLYSSAAGALISLMAFGVFDGSLLALTYSGGVGLLGFVLYDFWYSHFDRDSNSLLQCGKTLPDFDLFDLSGERVLSSSLVGKPTLFIFYRGNWCPLCMAQIKEVVGQYQQIAAKGVEVALISPQPHVYTQTLAGKFNVPYRFFVDVDNKAARRLNIVNEDGTPAGMAALGYDSETVFPTVLLTNAAGELVYVDLTENYRVRPEPDEFLRIINEANVVS